VLLWIPASLIGTEAACAVSALLIEHLRRAGMRVNPDLCSSLEWRLYAVMWARIVGEAVGVWILRHHSSRTGIGIEAVYRKPRVSSLHRGTNIYCSVW